MRRFLALIIIALLGVTSYFLFLNIFTGLKVKGYNYQLGVKEPYDVIIKYVSILDGTGENEMFKGDIGIRDGDIAFVGYLNDNESPFFDATGLTAIPCPIPFSKNDDMLEHLFVNSYPRYPAERIYVMSPPYNGRSLFEIAQEKGQTVAHTYKLLLNEIAGDKIILIPEKYVINKRDTIHLLAGLTGKRAINFDIKDRGAIRKGYRADIYLYKTEDYTKEELKALLLTGKLPVPLYVIKDGRFL